MGVDIDYWRGGRRYSYTEFAGDKIWISEGKFHREDGPARITSNGDKYWYREGIFHREDGPAIELSNGDRFWYTNGKQTACDCPTALCRPLHSVVAVKHEVLSIRQPIDSELYPVRYLIVGVIIALIIANIIAHLF